LGVEEIGAMIHRPKVVVEDCDFHGRWIASVCGTRCFVKGVRVDECPTVQMVGFVAGVQANNHYVEWVS